MMALAGPEFTPAKFGDSLSSEHSESTRARAVESPFLGKLAMARKLAFRRGVWYRVLNRIERGVVDLTVRYVGEIKSAKLAKVLTAIMEKLSQATESIADRLVRTIGVPLAKKMSVIAVTWGNVSASKWAEDAAFARYLAFGLAKT